MNEFDDDQLADELRRRSGPAVPTGAAHDRVIRRAGEVRRNRAAIMGGAGVVALVVAGLVLLPRSGADDTVADGTETLPTVVASTSSTSAPSTTTEPAGAPASTANTSTTLPGALPDPTSTSTSLPSAATTPSTPPSTTPRTTQQPITTITTIAGGDPSGSPTTSTTQPPVTTIGGTTATTTATTASTSSVPATTSSTTTTAPTTTEATLAPFTRTYDSSGGSITVTWNGSAFSLDAVAPASGFEAEIEDQSATRVRVRFRSDDADSRIELRVEGGELRVDIS